MKEDKEKSYWATRTAIGGLFRAVTLSTDPAHTLSFSSSLISTSRAALIQRLEDKVPDVEQIPGIINTILKIATRDFDLQPDDIKTIDDQIDKVFKTESMARYGLELYRDALFTEDLHARWKYANKIYIQSPASWAISNDTLADVHKQLLEIIVRHDLMQLPKYEQFSLDERGETYSQLAALIRDKQSAE